MRSPLLALLEESGAPVTLDDWLSASGCDDVYSGELLEVVPAEFAEEYRDRCRLYSEYENKFAEQQGMFARKLRGAECAVDAARPLHEVSEGR